MLVSAMRAGGQAELNKRTEEVLNASLKRYDAMIQRMRAVILNIFRPVLVNQPRKSMETRVDINELKNACLILNTAEYCQRTTEEVRIHRPRKSSN
jgi:hypothetical protein